MYRRILELPLLSTWNFHIEGGSSEKQNELLVKSKKEKFLFLSSFIFFLESNFAFIVFV